MGSHLCVFWWAAIEYNGELIFEAELISIWNSLAVSTGFLSVVQDFYDNVKVFEIASLKYTWVSGAGITCGINRLILLIVTLTSLSPKVVYRVSCFLFMFLNQIQNQVPWLFFKDLQNPKTYSRVKWPLIIPLLSFEWLLMGICFNEELSISVSLSSIISNI